MRFTVDSNLLVYAFIRDDAAKHAVASDIMIRAMLLDCVVAAQTLAEFLNVIRRKHHRLFDEARAQAMRWAATFQMLETRTEHVLEAAEFAARHKLQLWDSIIWQVARSAHAVRFLSEDLQDGLTIGGMTVVDPFKTPNETSLRELLAREKD